VTKYSFPQNIFEKMAKIRLPKKKIVTKRKRGAQ
jgi:hypothetical protein